MHSIILLTDDAYYRLGLERLLHKTLCTAGMNGLIIMDDGVRSLYFLSPHRLEGQARVPPAVAPVNEFISQLKLVAPRNIRPAKLIQIVTSLRRCSSYRRVLTPTYHRVLLDIACGVPSNISRRRMRLGYKTWHNQKGNAFYKLGIRSTISFMRAVHVWKSVRHHIMSSENNVYSVLNRNKSDEYTPTP